MAVIVISVKFWDGAWLVLVLIPLMVTVMSFIRRQYEAQEARAAGSATMASCRARIASSA